jgi:hypothetical protein
MKGSDDLLFASRFVNWPVFEWTIILTIIANCVVMALDDKLPVGDKTILSIKMVRILFHIAPLEFPTISKLHKKVYFLEKHLMTDSKVEVNPLHFHSSIKTQRVDY